MDLSKIIYTKRKEKGLSQEQLAEELNVARQTISKWEIGETLPDIESLRKLAITLEFSIDSVLDIDIDDNNDKAELFIIGAFIVGNALGIIFNNYLLGAISGIIGLGISFIVKAFKK